MHTIEARNVNDAYEKAIRLINIVGEPVQTRNGPAYRAPRPVTTTYYKPDECVLLDPDRDANPFFHVMEALWILAGRRDVAWLSYFNSRIATYSDNGVTFHGAYGWRLRTHFGVDQIAGAINLLRANPDDRRVVLSIWDPIVDLAANSKDIPCNDMCKVEIANGRLQLSVFNRSNDILWGCYGANAVQFSFLQQYIAAALGVPVGCLHQISTNWHWYGALPTTKDWIGTNPYLAENALVPLSLLTDDETIDMLDNDLRLFFQDAPDFLAGKPPYVAPREVPYQTRWMREVAWPMLRAWHAFKKTDFNGDAKPRNWPDALLCADRILAKDWRVACVSWLERRRLADRV